MLGPSKEHLEHLSEEELAEAAVSMLDAPISGGEEGAKDGSLSIIVGGSRVAFDAHASLFEAMGSTVTYCGDAGSGQITKACNQIVVGCTLQAVSEALVLAQRAGADVEAVVDAISIFEVEPPTSRSDRSERVGRGGN